MAADAAFTSALAEYYLDAQNQINITPAAVDGLLAQVETARGSGQTATNSTAEFHDVTQQEAVDEETLRAAIHAVQARAKNKYEEANPALLKAYYVGSRFDSRAQLEQAAAAIYGRIRTTDDQGEPVTPVDTLPNLKPETITALQSGYQAYTGVQLAQTAAQGSASDARTKLKEQCQQISRRRRKIQTAIDAEYPPGEENAAFRKEFGLPGDSAMR